MDLSNRVKNAILKNVSFLVFFLASISVPPTKVRAFVLPCPNVGRIGSKSRRLSEALTKRRRDAPSITLQSTDVPTETDQLDDMAEEEDEIMTEAATQERERLKLSLLKMCASYDRGFGATPSSRAKVESIIDELERINPSTDAARGISGKEEDNPINDDDYGPPPLEGIWRMVWTTAQDVLSLASSPTLTVGAIYQVIDPPVATNIIDLIPRAQALLPPGISPSSILRAEVTTRASPRGNLPMRVGLTFESVKFRPVEVMGVPVSGVLPPLGFNLPRINIPGSTPESSPGYFDVAYLDDELLVIRQNAPGGWFALIKVDNYDP